jgi:hypothetical protein
MLYREIITVYSEIHKKHINILCGQNASFLNINIIYIYISVSERPQTAHLLRSWVRIPPEAWIFVCCECRVLSGRSLR